MPESPDIAVVSVAAPLVVLSNSPFDVNVTVFAPDEDFEDGVAYRLFVFAVGLNSSFQIQAGHVQDVPWTTATSTITITLTAGPTPDLYQITAALLEGKQGFDANDPPSIVSAANPVLVI